jgi:serine/threonine-protein kinase HipA
MILAIRIVPMPPMEGALIDPALKTLAVTLHGRPVGVINRLAGDQHLFAFEQSYIDDRDRPTMSLSFKGTAGGLVTAVRPVFRRIPPFFSNVLPEGHLRAYLAQHAGVKPGREFFLLATLGADLPGALVVSPVDGDHAADRGAHAGADDDDDEAGQRSRNVLRFSLAGVQIKFSAVMEASGGLTIPADGIGGSWIVKLPSSRFAFVPENEFVMLELARAIGIKVPEIRLVPIPAIQGLPDDVARLAGRALAVRHLDRTQDGGRIHMEDFAQVFGIYPENKYNRRSYANIAAVLWAETGEWGTYEFFRRLVFSVIIGNADMHLKNWSLLYPDGRKPALSPAYDFVSTVPYLPNDDLALIFGQSRALDSVTKDQVRRFADTARLPASPLWALAMETHERTLQAWQTLAHKDLLPNDLREAIDRHIAQFGLKES